jgi:nicotinamidase-related amidase
VDRYTRPEFDRAALLTIDVQRDVLDREQFRFANPEAQLPNIVRVVQACRGARRPIIHVVRLYQPDGTNVDRCRRAAVERGEFALLVGTPGCAIVPELLSHPADLDTDLLLAGGFQPLTSNEVVMYKPRWGAFFDTRLLDHLRVVGVTTVMIIGCNFPNCPRATIIEASERDLRVVAITDAISRFTDRDAAEMREIGVAVMTAADVVDEMRVAATS